MGKLEVRTQAIPRAVYLIASDGKTYVPETLCNGRPYAAVTAITFTPGTRFVIDLPPERRRVRR